MARFLLGLLLISGVAHAAAPRLWQVLSQTQHVAPIAVMKDIEQRFPGIISEFNAELEDGVLIYELAIINPKDHNITELEVRGRDGVLLRHHTEKLKADDTNELQAALKILQHKQSFSELVTQAMQQHQSFLAEAQLDRDLGINYLELRLLSADGDQKLAFDIDQQKPLPLLTWD